MLELVSEDNIRIKGSTPDNYFEGRKCYVCGSGDTYIKNTGKPFWLLYYDDKGEWDGKSYLCNKCYLKDYQNSPGSHNHIQKMLAKCRTRCLSRDSSTGKAFIDQLVVSRVWGLDDLNLKNDDFRTPIDMIHSVLGGIDVKSSALNPEDVVDRYVNYGRCVFHTGRKRDCDTYILLCYDSKRENIIAVYIIPNDEKVSNMPFICIRNGTRSSKYDKFRADHSPYNDVYHLLDFNNDHILKHIFL